MVRVLGFIAIASFLVALLVGLVSFTSATFNAVDFILAAIYGTCGTVAAAGAAILHRLNNPRPPPPPA